MKSARTGNMFNSFSDIADVMSDAFKAEGAAMLLEADLGPAFFDLRTRLAGELFQKFMNYGLRLALVIDSPEQHGERFTELVREHRRHGNIRFFSTPDEARRWLQRD